MASENAQCSTSRRFWILKISCKIRSLETVPVSIVLQYYPHSNTVCIHMCDGCKKSILPIVCHMPESILWLILQACWLTIECQVVQFVPNTSISRQFASKLLSILQLIRVLHAWIDDLPGKDLKLCRVAPLSCLPIHRIAQRIFENVPPCRKTSLLCAREVFPIPVIFPLHCSIIVSFGLHWRWVHPKYTWSRYDAKRQRQCAHSCTQLVEPRH